MIQASFRSVKQEVQETLEMRTRLGTWLESDQAMRWITMLTKDKNLDWATAHSIQGAARVMAKTIKTSSPYFIENEMVDVAEAASKHSSFSPYNFSTAEMPSPMGFVLLGRIVLTEGDPEAENLNKVSLPIRGFFWDAVSARSSLGELKLVIWSLVDTDVAEHMLYEGHDNRLMTEKGIPRLSPAGHITTSFGATDWTEDHLSEHPDEEMRLLKTLWLLMGQRLSESKTIPAAKHEREKAERKGRAVPEVTVVTLRKMQSTEEYQGEHRDREYSHRFIVGGHWRTYKDERYNERLRSVPQWISPYVKGDPEKPLVVKQKVYRLAR